jgi:hypothetical protein
MFSKETYKQKCKKEFITTPLEVYQLSHVNYSSYELPVIYLLNYRSDLLICCALYLYYV